jgi:hypothetical protein
MYCDKCGVPVQPDQAFCSRCGRRLGSSVVSMPQGRSRVAEHVNLVAILWLAFSGFNALAGILILMAYHLFIGHSNVPIFLRPMLAGIGWFVLMKSAVGFAAGIGLLQREVWARTLTLILAFIASFTSIPIGTALGVYTMWVLLPRESEQEYEAMGAAKAA